MKILNLYAGIGGNRALWGEEHQITAVEYEPRIAAAYQTLYPNDTVVVGDAHQYLIDHYTEFEFIWSSPPCPTHSRMQLLQVGGKGALPKFPDGKLFEEVVFLANWFRGAYAVENVIPYYKQWIPGSVKIARHLYWANFEIYPYDDHSQENLRKIQIPELQRLHGVDLSAVSVPNKRQVLRNMVPPKVGKLVLDSYLKTLDAST